MVPSDQFKLMVVVHPWRGHFIVSMRPSRARLLRGIGDQHHLRC